MKLRPLADKIVVKPLEAEETVKGGIIIPDSAKEKPQQAEVVAVGPGKLDEKGARIPVDVKVGERVLVSKYGGDEFKIDDVEYKIVGADDVFAVVEK
jgi:chaperonin GroES